MQEKTPCGTTAAGPRADLHGVDEGGLDTYEPHFDVISQENDVQVYELVVDVTGALTNVLERAAGSAKDNRCCRWAFRSTILCTTPRGWKGRRCPMPTSPRMPGQARPGDLRHGG